MTTIIIIIIIIKIVVRFHNEYAGRNVLLNQVIITYNCVVNEGLD